MKIAFIRYRYDPFGGAERFTQALIHSLAERGAEVHVFARRWKEPVDPQVRFHRVGGPSRPSLVGHASFLLLAGRAVREGNFDLIQSNERTLCQHVYRAGDGVHARWLELRARHRGWLGRFSTIVNPFHLYRLWVERLLFEQPDLRAVVVNSEMVRGEILSRFAISADRIHTIYNGVDLERFHPANRLSVGADLRLRCGLSDDVPVVLFVGSGFERKGLEQLLHAMALAGGNARLWVVGKGKVNRYRRIAERLAIAEQTVFWGPQGDVAPFYAAADIFALPTLYDPFPTVVLEAMASGLPVVTTAQCGAAEIVSRGENGFVVAYPEKTSEMAGHLAHLYQADHRHAMSIKARKRAEQFPLARTIRELELLYDQILAERRP